jgi:two-component system, NarL family, nitrate/nitrite sensor histidine kinase NarX
MVDRHSFQVQFPARLDRRLVLTVAGIVAVFLLVGGLSIVLTRNVARLHLLVDHERLHIQMVGDIRAAFAHLIFELQQAQLAGTSPMRDALVLHADLVESLKSFRDLHAQEEGIPEDGQERVAFTSLWESTAVLRPLAESVTNPSSLAPRLEPRDLERLGFVAHQIPDKTTMLSQAHEARITRLLDGSQNVQQAILILYLATFCMGGLLVVVAGRAFYARIAAPLRSLAAAAGGIAEGRLEGRVPVASRDEIGRLSHAFNVMAEGLETRERELRSAHAHLERKLLETEALNQIGSEMVAFTGPETILQSIVDKARETLYVDAVAICLTAADSGELKVSATSGPAEAFRAEVTMAHRSAGETRGTVHALAECPAMHSEHIRSHVAFPLKRGHASIGVLCVGSREERSFSAEEQRLLFALAAQAAITVEHGRLDAQVRGFAVEEERGRIARDMHDGLAQSVSLLHLKARQAQVLLTAGKTSQAADTLGELADISASAYDEVRQSIFGLRTMVSGGLGIIPALTELLHEFSERNDLPVKLEADGAEPIRLSPASEFQLIRIVQEALTNVRKHAHSQNARVRVERQDSWVRVSVEDDGSGFDPAKVTSPNGLHFGLQGMRERAERLGGTLEIVTVPDRGTRVTASLPLESA